VKPVRTIMLIAATAAALTASVSVADADRICRQVCAEGFCQTQCVDNNDHIFLDNNDKNFYYEHGRPDVLRDRD
jgi:hypothetical protein